MNLVWHIVKKDFTRLRLPLGLWAAVLLGSFVVAGRLFSPGSIEGEWFNHQSGAQGLTTLVWVLAGYILVAALALEDTLVGTQMFWATRPISGGRLLAAKILGAFLFFILGPVLVSLPWWLWCGFGLRDTGYAALQVMVLQAVVVLPALTLSAVAGQSSRFLLGTLVMLIAVPAGTGTVAYYLPKGLPAELLTSRVILAYGLGAVTAGVIIWLQYRSRRLVRSLLVALAGVGLVLLIGCFWPWDVTGLWPKDTSQLAGTEKITLNFSETTLESKGGRHRVIFLITAKDIPAELGILKGSSEVEFRWPDGTTYLRGGHVSPVNPDYTARSRLNLPPVQMDAATENKKREMAEAYQRRVAESGRQSQAPLPAGVTLFTSVDLPPEIAAKFTTPPAVRISLRLETGWAELLLEVPLKEGAGKAANGVRLQVLKLEPVETSKPAMQVSATVITSQSARMEFVQFLLVDRTHGTVIMEGASLIRPPTSFLPMGINRSLLRLNIPQLWRDDQWVGAPEWLEQDTLAAVTYRPDGGFDRVLQADRLEFVKK